MLEREVFSTINIKEFYLRRIFRIWPLYYFYIALTLLLTFFIAGHSADNIKYLWLFIFFVPNIAFNLNLYPQFMAHLWSIGIEEQFYAIWPQVIKKTNKLKRNILIFICLFLILKLGLKLLSLYIQNKLPFSIISTMRFDCMAVGALFSIIYKNGISIKRPLLLVCQIIFWILFLLSFIPGFSIFSIYGDEMFSILTGFIILGQLDKKNCLISLENPVLNFLGRISYGMYVYHVLILFILKFVLINTFHYKIQNTLLLILYVLIFTIIISFLSYKYFELYFIKMKKNFSRILSRN